MPKTRENGMHHATDLKQIRKSVCCLPLNYVQNDNLLADAYFSEVTSPWSYLHPTGFSWAQAHGLNFASGQDFLWTPTQLEIKPVKKIKPVGLSSRESNTYLECIVYHVRIVSGRLFRVCPTRRPICFITRIDSSLSSNLFKSWSLFRQKKAFKHKKLPHYSLRTGKLVLCTTEFSPVSEWCVSAEYLRIVFSNRSSSILKLCNSRPLHETLVSEWFFRRQVLRC